MFITTVIGEDDHSTVLEFHFKSYEFNAYGCFHFNLEYIQMVRIFLWFYVSKKSNFIPRCLLEWLHTW